LPGDRLSVRALPSTGPAGDGGGHGGRALRRDPARRVRAAMTRTESPLTDNRIAEVYRSRLSTGRARLGEMLGGQIEVESTGAWVRTADGRHYLNAGGYGVFIMGARHPAVVDAVHRQLHTHPVGT